MNLQLTAGILAFTGGLFGLHKFVLGYRKQGFTMLALTIGSLGFLGVLVQVTAIVEGCIYLTRSKAQFDAHYLDGKRGWF